MNLWLTVTSTVKETVKAKIKGAKAKIKYLSIHFPIIKAAIITRVKYQEACLSNLWIQI